MKFTRIAPVAALSAGLIFTGSAAASATSEGDSALEVLDTIEVAEDYAEYDYSSEVRDEEYGDRWTDADGTGCTTREDILIRDLDPETTSVDGECRVEYGQAIDPYSGEWMEHTLGQSQVDIEHVVAVGQAHRNGAWEWDDEKKAEFYQDKDNLMIASASENSAKSDRDAAPVEDGGYWPSNQAAYCDFAATMVFVKDKWKLTMNEAEHAEIERVLTSDDCEGQQAVPAVAMIDADYDPDAQHSAVEEGNGNGSEDTEATGTKDGILPDGVEWWMVAAGAVVVLLIIGGVLPKSALRNARR